MSKQIAQRAVLGDNTRFLLACFLMKQAVIHYRI
jgi:hypothetical protein